MELKTVQKELNQLLKGARKQQKDIIEEHFTTMNSRKLWDSMKAITNTEPSKRHISATDDVQKANELNDFYLRFQSHDFSNQFNIVLDSLTDDLSTRPEVENHKVQSLFPQLCTNKSSGPDGIKNLC